MCGAHVQSTPLKLYAPLFCSGCKEALAVRPILETATADLAEEHDRRHDWLVKHRKHGILIGFDLHVTVA